MTAERPCWYAINTKLREEERADRNLTAWGVESFAPRIRKRRNSQYSGRPVYVSQSLFPSYIFARFVADRMLHKVYNTRGVKSVVSFNGEPLRVEDEIIALIQSQVGKDGYARFGEELKHGDAVVVNEGAFKGIGGIFDRSKKDSDRVEILLTAINYQATIIVEKDMVRKVGQSYCNA